MDAEGGAVEHLGVLATVEQRLAYQVVDDCPEPALGPCCCLGSPSQVVVAAGQQVAGVASCWSAAASARRCSVPVPPCRGPPARRRSHRASPLRAARRQPATGSPVSAQTAPRQRWAFTLNSTSSSIAAIRSCGVWSSANRSAALASSGWAMSSSGLSVRGTASPRSSRRQRSVGLAAPPSSAVLLHAADRVEFLAGHPGQHGDP